MAAFDATSIFSLLEKQMGKDAFAQAAFSYLSTLSSQKTAERPAFLEPSPSTPVKAKKAAAPEAPAAPKKPSKAAGAGAEAEAPKAPRAVGEGTKAWNELTKTVSALVKEALEGEKGGQGFHLKVLSFLKNERDLKTGESPSLDMVREAVSFLKEHPEHQTPNEKKKGAKAEKPAEAEKPAAEVAAKPAEAATESEAESNTSSEKAKRQWSPEAKARAAEKRAAKKAEKEAAAAESSSESEAKPAADAEPKKVRKPWSDAARAAQSARARARAEAKKTAALPTTLSRSMTNAHDEAEAEDAGNFEPFSHEGQSLFKNARGDVLTEEMDWVGVFNEKTGVLDKSAAKPAYLDI